MKKETKKEIVHSLSVSLMFEKRAIESLKLMPDVYTSPYGKRPYYRKYKDSEINQALINKLTLELQKVKEKKREEFYKMCRRYNAKLEMRARDYEYYD